MKNIPSFFEMLIIAFLAVFDFLDYIYSKFVPSTEDDIYDPYGVTFDWDENGNRIL